MTPLDVGLPDVSIKDLEARWGLSRNGLKARARALGVELKRVSSTLTTWPGDFVELGDRLDDHIKGGQPTGTFPGLAPITDGTDTTEKAITKRDVSPEVLASAIATAMAASFLPATSSDPMKRAKALAEAADAALVLTTDELVALGVKGVEGFADGDCAYGYSFHKHNQRNRVLWTIERALLQRSLPPTKVGSRQVGFGAAVEACLDLTPVGFGSHIFAINSL
jgi:hypothetical protein